MDEIVGEDLNELESRLYAQIHHEAVEIDNIQTEVPNEIPEKNILGPEHTFDEFCAENKLNAISEKTTSSSQEKCIQNVSKTSDIVNTNTSGNQTFINNAKSTLTTSISNTNKFQKIKSNNSIQYGNNTKNNSITKFKNPNNPFNTTHGNLILNPAKYSKQNKPEKKKQQKKDKSKNAPFTQQFQKLEKCKRVAEKIQKSIEVRKKRNKNRVVNCETINLTLSDDDSNDEVEVVVMPSPPIYTIDDSDDDKTNNLQQNIFNIEENALDATDIDMSITNAKSSDNSRSEDLQTNKDIRSRCNSPCSVQSTDDFIGIRNSKQFEKSGTEQANDEDLLLLTADVDSSMDTTIMNRASKIPANIDLCQTKENMHTLESSNNNSSSEFLVPTPATTVVDRNNFCVKEKQFRAIDIYESESDLNDGVYCKGLLNRTTIVREIGSSDDDNIIEDINVVSKAKRLRKRRASSSNKDSEANNDSTDFEDEDIGNTPVMGIMRGPAVEMKLTKSIKDLSSKDTIKSNESIIDNAFIETLNSLAQGGDEAESESSDEETCRPTARDIAEKVLQNDMLKSKSSVIIVDDDNISVPKTITAANKSVMSDAIPNDGSIDKLEKIFNTIDKLDQNTSFINYSERMNLSENNEELLVVNPLSNKQLHLTQTADLRNKFKRNGNRPRYTVCSSDCDKLWPDEMLKFYNCSWNGENFNVIQKHSTMKTHKDNWKINTLDRFPQSRAPRKTKCFNCCEFGHMTSTCSRPKKPVVCSICGQSGHREPRCPNTVCLRCGNKTLTFVRNCNACTFHDRITCSICKVRGHIIDNCPDKWRRYHSTTKPDMMLETHVEYNNKKYCCICGRRGHLSESCRYHYLMGYPISVSRIKSHQKSYSDLSINRSDCNIKVNLLYNPTQHISFRFKHNIKDFNCYARFLRAVGLSRMLKRKRCAKPSTAVEQKKIKNNSDAPNQVQEVSESGNISDNKSSTEVQNNNETNTSPIYVLTDEDITEAESLSPINVMSANVVNEFNLTNMESSEDEEIFGTNNATKEAVVNIVDSDSNYSFSEHFASDHNTVPKNILNIKNTDDAKNCDNKSHQNNIANQNIFANNFTSETTATEIINEISVQTFAPNIVDIQKTKSRPMEALPDFIPFTTTTKKSDSRRMDALPSYISLNTNKTDKEYENATTSASQKKRYFSTATSENVNTTDTEKESPSEVMLCVPIELIKYFETKEGRFFLTEKSKFHNVRVRFGNSSVGKSIFLFGLKCNQDSFHADMLQRFGNFQNDNKNRTDNSSNVPRRVEVIIRFLRENLNQLMNKLGNANELLKNMTYHENQGSKTSTKLAEKERRLLNMILLGQAGLLNGNKHLDNLLVILKKLIHEHNSEGNASEELRNEINSHWKLIFTSYRHNDYYELVKIYNRLLNKNRMLKINLDPVLLGNKIVDTSLTNQQKEHLEQLKPKVNSTTVAANTNYIDIISDTSSVENTKSSSSKTQNFKVPQQHMPAQSKHKVSVSSTMKKQQQQTMSKPENATSSSAKLNITTPTKKQISMDPPFKKPEQKSTVAENLKNVSQNWQTTCHNLLTELDGSKKQSQNRLIDVTAASMFWSREAMKYLDECVLLSEYNNNLLSKLKRVQNKSENGLLSYNDYRAVIKLHTAMTGK